jgi:hypothetical protein
MQYSISPGWLLNNSKCTNIKIINKSLKKTLHSHDGIKLIYGKVLIILFQFLRLKICK